MTPLGKSRVMREMVLRPTSADSPETVSSRDECPACPSLASVDGGVRAVVVLDRNPRGLLPQADDEQLVETFLSRADSARRSRRCHGPVGSDLLNRHEYDGYSRLDHYDLVEPFVKMFQVAVHGGFSTRYEIYPFFSSTLSP